VPLGAFERLELCAGKLACTVLRRGWYSNVLFLSDVIYTTNAIESLNSVIRHAIKKRKVFPTDDSVRKVIYLAIMQASKKWTMPIRDWRQAMNRFMVEFEDRIQLYV
jgi:transposase-like protein